MPPCGYRARFIGLGMDAPINTGTFYNYTSHSRGPLPAILAPADSPSKEQFTLQAADGHYG